MARVYTLAEFAATDDPMDGHLVYVVSHPEIGPLYVGKSTQVRNRMYLHRANRSALGQEIVRNRPASDAWTITLYDLLDCLELVKKHRSEEMPWYEMNAREGRCLDSCLRDAEQSMIAELDPPLNGQWW